MKTLRVAVVTAMVGAFAALAPSPAHAQEPDPYGDVTVTVSENTVVGGNNITITATVNPSEIQCEWTLTFMGDTREGGPSNSITEVFTTPEVDEVEQHEAVATCNYDQEPSALGAGGSKSLGTSLVMNHLEATGSGTQTLLPEGDDGDGDGDGDGDDGGLLPNTGGERLLWLIIGVLLITVGGGVVMASRRRDA